MRRFLKFLSVGGWIALGQGGAALGQLVGVRLMTEVVPPDVFGSAMLCLGFSALLLTTCTNPVLQALQSFYPEAALGAKLPALRAAGVALQRNGILFGTVLTAIVGGASVLWMDQSWLAIVSLVALLVLDCLRSFELALFNAARRHRAYGLWQVADAWARPGATLALVAVYGASVEMVLAGYFLGALLCAIGALALARREGTLAPVEPDASSVLQFRKKLVRYLVPLLPLGIIGWTTGLADRYLIAGLLDVASAGIYAAVYGVVSRPMLMASAVVEMAVRPIYYERLAAGNHAEAKRLILGWLTLVLVVCSVILGIVGFFHAELAALFLGPAYRAGSSLMPWIAAGYALLALSHVFTRICYAYRRTRSVLAIEAIGAVASIVVAVPMIFAFGMRGAAWSVPVYFFIQLVVSAWAAERTVAHAPGGAEFALGSGA